ncbi:hypothetical protein Glove_1033g8 [Diversispora epigaea]|uniref:Uncharacterized protein n=1 Tax=Diversispora epigaea TaxID=1348612 RepID=A0A397G0F7_9GLOM|nr:hypothetical protein Glove_1033g8 [Diversispora epigaea]
MLSFDQLEILSLREIMKAIIQRAIEEYNWWDKCSIPQYKRDESLRAYKKVIESADEVYELLLQEHPLFTEKDRIRKKGIRPTSFFQSSFRLLEEENEENLVGPI